MARQTRQIVADNGPATPSDAGPAWPEDDDIVRRFIGTGPKRKEVRQSTRAAPARADVCPTPRPRHVEVASGTVVGLETGGAPVAFWKVLWLGPAEVHLGDAALTSDEPAKTTSDDLLRRNRLRVWLRLFATTTLIEGEIRSNLRKIFDFTLPRFDLLAQLARHPDGITLTELSRLLMVTAGNITAVCDKLLEDGYITRAQSRTDRRSNIVKMTHAGRAAFEQMSIAHADWISDLLKDVPAKDLDALYTILSSLKKSLDERSTV